MNTPRHERGERRRAAARTYGTLLSAAALATGLLPPSPAAAAYSGADGLIAFTSNRDGNDEIYVMAKDGSAQTNLTADPARDQDPAWSADGSRIAFASTRAGHHLDIWTMNADGSAPVNLTPLPETSNAGESGVEPAWSPDASRIAYASSGDVWVMNADGSGKVNLTHDPAIPAAGWQPAWSPDGSKIAYIRGFDIWVMNADGTAKTQLTATTGALGTEKAPDWSPDGTRIVYEKSGQIWRMNADGSGQRALAAGTGKGGTRPAWSAAGNRIVFSSNSFSAPDGYDIFVMNPDGTGVKRFATAVPAADLDPSWQPTAASGRLPTYTSLAVNAGTTITASGELFTAHPGETMTVTLFKKVGTTFQKVSSTTPVLSPFGAYTTSFADPGATSCKVVARFPGDVDHLPSQKAKVFAC